jgi:hypothetical protein
MSDPSLISQQANGGADIGKESFLHDGSMPSPLVVSLRSWYTFLGLTPRRTAFLHLVLIGIPFRFGLRPTDWGNRFSSSKLLWIYSDHLDGPCAMFEHFPDESCRNATEYFAIHDFAARYIVQHSFMWVVWWVLLSCPIDADVVSFHFLLILSTFASAVSFVILQHVMLLNASFGHALDHSFFSGFMLYHLLSIGLSVWTIVARPTLRTESMTWSIPANALFCGGVS